MCKNNIEEKKIILHAVFQEYRHLLKSKSDY